MVDVVVDDVRACAWLWLSAHGCKLVEGRRREFDEFICPSAVGRMVGRQTDEFARVNLSVSCHDEYVSELKKLSVRWQPPSRVLLVMCVCTWWLELLCKFVGIFHSLCASSLF